MLLDGLFTMCLAGLLVASRASAACTSNLVIDDFTKWTSGVNNLDWQNGGESESAVNIVNTAQLTGTGR
jgi:hypothetical protein